MGASHLEHLVDEVVVAVLVAGWWILSKEVVEEDPGPVCRGPDFLLRPAVSRPGFVSGDIGDWPAPGLDDTRLS